MNSSRPSSFRTVGILALAALLPGLAQAHPGHDHTFGGAEHLVQALVGAFLLLGLLMTSARGVRLAGVKLARFFSKSATARK